MCKKSFVITLVALFVSFFAVSQEVETLINKLDSVSGIEKVDLLLDITWKLRNTDPNRGLRYCQQAIKLADSLKDYADEAKAYSFLGVLYRNLGYYSIAFSYYKKALDIAEKYNITEQQGYGYNNLGNIYLYQKQPSLAIKYLQLADSVAKVLQNEDMRAYAKQNIGRAYILLNEPDSAIEYLLSALEIRKKINAKRKIPVTYKYLADAYKLKGDYKKAQVYYRLTASTADFDNDLDLLSDYSYQMADLFLKLEQPDSALKYAKMAVKAAEIVKTLYREMLAFEILSKVYAYKEDYKAAYINSRKAMELKDKIFTDEVIKGVKSIEFTEATAKREAKIKLLEKDLEIKALQAKRKTYVLEFVILIAFIVLFMLFFVLRQNANIKRYAQALNQKNEIINQQNEELQQQASILEKVNEQLEEKNRDITQSIEYANRIKYAMMVSEADLQKCPIVKDYFIIDKPRDIIGGDFYYFKRFKNFIGVIVGDATGHGIPGAFISIVSIAIFKDLLYGAENPDAAEILSVFRTMIKSVLRQEQADVLIKDGVDVSLCFIYPERNILNFAGAYQNFYYISQGKLNIVKGERTTAGFSFHDRPFVNHNLPLDDIDKFYLFTDGIIDQLGGKNYTRFGSYRFQNLIIEINKYPMKEQARIIEEIFNKWKEENRQTDDILIVGIEIDKQTLQGLDKSIG